MVLLAVCAPLAMGLFLLLMERLEAALFPVRVADDGPQQQGQPPTPLVRPPDPVAERREAA